MKSIKMKLTGISPLMTHNERLANPRDPETQKLKALTSIKKKTEELLERIAKQEWEAGLYEEKGVPVIPADNVLACLKEAAKKQKLGKVVAAAVFSQEASFALEYDGPKNREELWQDGRFFDYRTVVVSRRRVMRARPKFDEWSVTVELTFDPEQISEAELMDSMATAGLSIGLCEKRPQFGRFEVERV